jgi:hypothetical protein
MNSAQRRKHRRRWCHRIGYHEINQDFDAYRFHDMVAWCNSTYGYRNWQLDNKSGFWFLFDRRERVVEFVLRWS